MVPTPYLKKLLPLVLCGLIASCASTMPQVRVISCPVSEHRQLCPDQVFQLRDGSDQAKSDALAEAAVNYDACKKRHASLVAHEELCDRHIEALKQKLKQGGLQ